MNKFIISIASAGMGAVIALALVFTGLIPAVVASVETHYLVCADRNRNNVIDKDEAIDVIVLYINGTPLVTVAEQISDHDPLAGIDAYC